MMDVATAQLAPFGRLYSMLRYLAKSLSPSTDCTVGLYTNMEMALVTSVQRVDKERQAVHGPTHCSYTVFTREGQTYLQLDTYGSATRKVRDKISQSMQFNSQSAKQLKELIEMAFPELN